MRLADNRYRSIILARGGDYWVFEFLFAKQDMADIDESSLANLRTIAKGYSTLTALQVAELLTDQDRIEICEVELERGT